MKILTTTAFHETNISLLYLPEKKTHILMSVCSRRSVFSAGGAFRAHRLRTEWPLCGHSDMTDVVPPGSLAVSPSSKQLPVRRWGCYHSVPISGLAVCSL